MVVNARPLKRVKRRVMAVEDDFLTFPSMVEGKSGEGLDGPFRENVREFLASHASLAPLPSILIPSGDGRSTAAAQVMTWRVPFRVGGEAGVVWEGRKVVELLVVEEDVARSNTVYCDHCRVVGWSGHPVCGKRFHFIIQNESSLLPKYLPCTHCGGLLLASDSRCTLCNSESTFEDLDDCPYLQLEDSTHLLHGVVHINGYGHLLRINGREGGSKFLTGCDIMGFWDRMCKLLRVRKITVMDVSKKYGMEYRLLQAVVTGQPWYGAWGYEFSHGSFAVTAEAFQKAVATLSTIPLSIYFTQTRSNRTTLQDKISFYCFLSERRLVTLRDLFCYVTQLLHDAREEMLDPPSTPKKKNVDKEDSGGLPFTWAMEDIEQAKNSIIKVLRAVDGSRWVTWRSLRGATSQAVGSPELLNYCLKHLGGKVADDGRMVAARCNAESNALEYRLVTASPNLVPKLWACKPTTQQLLNDLRFFYDALLNPGTMLSYKPQAVREFGLSSAAKLLDCKQFIKHYDEVLADKAPSNPFMLHIWCHVELVDQQKDYAAPLPELLVIPPTATVDDLKRAATRAFQETYLIFQKFQAEELVDYRDVSGNTQVQLLIGSNGSVRIRGRCFEERRLGQFRMERGIDMWIVDCTCGAKDDDGERMLACDACGVWQHTRCAGINDLDEVPTKYICNKCISKRRPANRGKGQGKSRCRSSSNRGRCKDEMVSSFNVETGMRGKFLSVG